MLITYSKYGTGIAAKASKYFLQLRDHLGTPRAEIRVLRGDPELVAGVADSLKFVHRYTSGVIAWHPDDNPTPEQIEAVLDQFERLSFAGLHKNQYCWSAILHREQGGGVHVHIFVARVDLETGKSLNIAPPGWQKDFDALRDYWNHKEGWARPDVVKIDDGDDPDERARLLQPGFHAYREAASLRAGLQVDPHPKKIVTEYLIQCVNAGIVKDRKDILNTLKNAGFNINREGKNYITIVDPETDVKHRLKGALYEESWTVEQAIKVKHGKGKSSNRRVDERAARIAQEKLEQSISRRSEFNAKKYLSANRRSESRYQKTDKSIKSGIDKVDKDYEQLHDKNEKSIAFQYNDNNDDNFSYINSFSNSNMGNNFVLIEEDNKSVANYRNAKQDNRRNEKSNVGSGFYADVKREICNISGEYRNRVVENEQQKSNQSWGLNNDGTGKQINASISEVDRRIDATIRIAKQANSELEIVVRTSKRTNIDTQKTVGAVMRGRENLRDEIEIFKRDINLVEYAQAQGYDIDRKESGPNSIILRSEDDKIVVTTNTINGHGIYFSVRDDTDKGTIVDFVQKRQNLNMGQVRKELRPWANLPDPGRPAPRQKPQPKKPYKTVSKPIPLTKERSEIVKEWLQCKDNPEHPYLIFERKIDSSILSDPRFSKLIKSDERGNAVFVHRDREGISGFEKKNKGFTGFTAGGKKAIWYSNNIFEAERIIICESAIDALSYAQINYDKNDAYVSFGGQLSEFQKDLLKNLIEKALERDSEIVLAMDNDEQGLKYVSEIKNLIASTELSDDKITKDLPTMQDWNDQLKCEILKQKNELKSYNVKHLTI